MSVVSAELRIDVSDALPGAARGEIAATIWADPSVPGPRTVATAFPGGGYTRAYYDLDTPELDGPGQARFHAERGWIVVACDPLGGGDSAPLDDESTGLEPSAYAAHLVAEAVRERLAAGTAVPGLPPCEAGTRIGIGHSLGGMQLIHQQARHRSFDAVAVLGFSAVHTVIPTPDGSALAPHDTGASVADAWSGPFSDDLSHLRYAYHWEDVPAALVEADMSAGFPVRTRTPLPPWICSTFPPFAAFCMSPGVVAGEAATIDVPVFLGAGERDVLRDLRVEPAAYRSTRDVTVHEVPRCAHMHNFSPQRGILWSRLHGWGDLIASYGAKGEAA
ncbi:hypothetical protein [Streptomyces arenae]|uniref:hypothetical protein n=1 Tax=Streptomyces arenae TaxID=29301 RepID=UPI002657BA9D|nr:hypothetical protein [Streptomyces arenae]MCG7205128.1 hypothetical protein [Streptomyces arenae]